MEHPSSPAVHSDVALVPGPRRSARPLVLRPAGTSHQTRWRPGERLDHLFEEVCARLRREGRTDRLAVDAPGRRWTYSKLDEEANRLARHLLIRGARPGQRVALLLDDPVWSYVSMLAVLKVGAAFVPLDVGFPDERIGYIVGDSEVTLVVTASHLRDRLQATSVLRVCLDTDAPEVRMRSGARLTDDERGPDVDECAYVIYTSGSTGRPKGVTVDHSSICNFVRVADETYGLLPSDRVYQGMTIAFDFSVEEIWVPWMAGATLVPKPAGRSLVGRDLGEFLQERSVTALCCVPTLLATLEENLPDLRFLLVSGEACPRDLVTRWHRPGLRFLNVYGPTEATVTATWTVLRPDRPVTIGVPLPTYAVVILDEETQEPLAAGELGEIAIAGPGLARGYVNRDDLTRRAFIPDPLHLPYNPSHRLYRTGDLGRVLETGEIEYQGRIDTQVKVRGYRIELSEIESVMLQVPGVAQAVVHTHAPEPGVTELVGFFTARGSGASPEAVHERLREVLPNWMVPAYIEELPSIPMLPSDKADRKALPPPSGPRLQVRAGVHVPPATPVERTLADTLAEVLRVPQVSVESHLFDELGADSLLMARFCARLRADCADLPSLSMQDIYLHPTVRRLAATLASAAPDTDTQTVEARSAHRPTTTQFLLCGAVQLLVFLGLTWLSASVLLAAYGWVSTAPGTGSTFLRGWTAAVGGFLYLALLPIAAKWLLVGRWKAGEFDVWGPAYIRFWVVKTLTRANPMIFFVGTPLYALYLRALGARIGAGVVILSRDVPVCTDLLTIGAGTVVRKDAVLSCFRARAGRIETGPVTLGSDVVIGEHAVLDIGVAMGDGSQLGHASSLHTGQAVPAGQRWHGSPAVPTSVDYRRVDPVACSRARRVAYSALQVVYVVFVALPLAVSLAGLWIPDVDAWGDPDFGSAEFYGVMSGFTLAVFLGGLISGLVVVAVVPRVVARAFRPDVTYPLYGLHFALHRLTARLTNVKSYMMLFGDSSYIVHYLRWLGYDLSRVEQSGSNFGVEQKHETPFGVHVGSGTMVSDGLSALTAEFTSTSFRLTPVQIGERNFLGNNITFPAGGRAGENCLLATKVMVPVDGPVRTDVGLLGSPPFEIPRSVLRDRPADALLDRDELQRRLAGKNRHNRATIGLFLLARWLHFYVVTLVLLAAFELRGQWGSSSFAVASLAILLFGIAYYALIEHWSRGFRRLSPRFCSIYDSYFWRHERFWKLCAPTYVESVCNGTPFKGAVWRLLGVRVGRRLLDLGCAVPERTLVALGDDVVLNPRSTIQCHSLEDGAFKSDHVVIGNSVTLGPQAFVHYAVTLGDGVTVEADSFLMKGEEVPAGATWRGNPARPARGLVGGDASPAPVARVVPRVPRQAAPRVERTASGATIPAPVTATRRVLNAVLAAEPVPPRPGVHLSVLSLDEGRALERELLQLLPGAERREARTLTPSRRRAYVARHALLRAVLTTHLDPAVAPPMWVVDRASTRKPVVASPQGARVHVGIAHTDELLVVATAQDTELGVDLEPVSSAPDDVVWEVLTHGERQALLELPERQRAVDFVRMWTAKEAYVECVGLGCAVELAEVDTTAGPVPAARGQGLLGRERPPSWFHQQRVRVDGRAHWLALVGRPAPPPSPAPVVTVRPHARQPVGEATARR